MTKHCLTMLIILQVFSMIGCGDPNTLPFRGTGFGGPQNQKERSISKKIKNTPIVFLHGSHCDADIWKSARKYFLQNGYNPYEIFAITFSDNTFKSPKAAAKELKSFIDNVKRYTLKNKISIIAHSRGGLIARYYLKKYQEDNSIQNCVLIASANHGSPNINAWYVKPGNKFLKNLNASGELIPGIRYLCVRAQDDYFFPRNFANSPYLKGAKNLMISGTNHLSIVNNVKTFRVLFQFIKSYSTQTSIN